MTPAAIRHLFQGLPQDVRMPDARTAQRLEHALTAELEGAPFKPLGVDLDGVAAILALEDGGEALYTVTAPRNINRTLIDFRRAVVFSERDFMDETKDQLSVRLATGQTIEVANLNAFDVPTRREIQNAFEQRARRP